jgi:hypothetical protein
MTSSLAVTLPSLGFAAARPRRGREPSQGEATGRATRCPCLGLALAAGGALWAGLGSALLLVLLA